MEKKQNKLVVAIIVIAVIINLITVIMTLIQHFFLGGLVLTTIVAIEHMAVIYYVLIGYKKPHGNMLRCVMLLFALTIGLDFVVTGTSDIAADTALCMASLIIIPYIAGRLNKIEKNKVLISLVLIMLFIDAVIYIIYCKAQTFVECYRIFGPTIEWFAISAAYFVRYKEHKEAGLADAPKE